MKRHAVVIFAGIVFAVAALFSCEGSEPDVWDDDREPTTQAECQRLGGRWHYDADDGGVFDDALIMKPSRATPAKATSRPRVTANKRSSGVTSSTSTTRKPVKRASLGEWECDDYRGDDD